MIFLNDVGTYIISKNFCHTSLTQAQSFLCGCGRYVRRLRWCCYGALEEVGPSKYGALSYIPLRAVVVLLGTRALANISRCSRSPLLLFLHHFGAERSLLLAAHGPSGMVIHWSEFICWAMGMLPNPMNGVWIPGSIHPSTTSSMLGGSHKKPGTV
jgi:hypothetical protein